MTPVMVRILEPIPSICAPMETSIRQRSCTCGSLAALVRMVLPWASAAAITAFSVPVTEASSRKMSAPFRRFALKVKVLLILTFAPSSVRARKWVSSRRLPITSPPGGGSAALPVRAKRGPANSIEALIFFACSRGISEDLMSRRVSRQALGSRAVTSPPRAAYTSSITCTSSMSGMFRSITGSSVRRAAAMQGRAAFLLPLALTVPFRGTPPSIRYSLIN